MGAWTKNKVDSSQINGGQEYTRNDNPSLEQLNAITNNSFYAVNKADEALVKANSAFENNGTVVRVGGSPVANLGFDSDPQSQINSKANQVELNGINEQVNTNTVDIGLLTSNKANNDLSNVTYPEIVYDPETKLFDGLVHTGAGDRIVERKVYSDGKTWYEKYESGWKRCGGVINTTNNITQVLLPIEFNTTTYTTLVTIRFDTPSATSFFDKPLNIRYKTENTFEIYAYSVAGELQWECVGF